MEGGLERGNRHEAGMARAGRPRKGFRGDHEGQSDVSRRVRVTPGQSYDHYCSFMGSWSSRVGWRSASSGNNRAIDQREQARGSWPWRARYSESA